MPPHPDIPAPTAATGATPIVARATNPYLFIVGCPRSGTTMLKRMVKAHPLVAMTRETHWIPRPYEKQKGVTTAGEITPRIVDELFSHRRFPQMKFKRADLEQYIRDHPALTYAELVSEIFCRYGQRKGKPLVGDKTPPYVRKLPTLAKLWPQARIVHLVRDGRNVWLSMKNWRMAHKAAGAFATWSIDPLVTTALWWRALVMLGHQDGRKLDQDRYDQVSYEALVANPSLACGNLANFLDIPYDEAMVRYHEGKKIAGTNGSTNNRWLPPTPNVRDWQTQMELQEVTRFELAAGDALRSFGYEVHDSAPEESTKRQVRHIKQEFTADAQLRRWRLPTNW